MNRSLSRRDFLHLAASLTGASASGWLPNLARAAAGDPSRKRSCILLWMAGGPSQTDTFDMKPGHANGGEFQPIRTRVPGIQISEHLPHVAKQMEDICLVRSMSTIEGDHSRAARHLRTGYPVQASLRFPTLGSMLSKQLGEDDSELPNYVSIAAPQEFLASGGPGFLGPQFAPLVVGDSPEPWSRHANAPDFRIQNIQTAAGVTPRQADARLGLLNDLEKDFLARRGGFPVESRQAAYRKAVRMLRSDAAKTFVLDDEPDKLRDAYGRSSFGQGCLLARRLVERGAAFVEVVLEKAGDADWDTHSDNFTSVKKLCGVLDPAWATLLRDLKDRGLLETTLVVWMGEFGRTPKINDGGRDHFPAAWTTALCGGGIQGGGVVGETTSDGMEVKRRPVAVEDLIATICKGVGVDPKTSNFSHTGRPIRLAAPEAKPIDEILR